MYKNLGEAIVLAKEVAAQVTAGTKAEVVLCPPFTALAAVKNAIAGTPVKLGAQNVHWADQGAYTGEIAPGMLKDIGCDYVIVGHSERRQYFAETDASVNQKVKAVLKAGLTPIVCVGETLQEREAGATERIVDVQVREGLAGLSAAQVSALVIAYEPIWAIGTGKTASAEEANAVCAFIRRTVGDVFGQGSAGAVRIQYGGSVNPENIGELMAKPDIDGALVGGASLKPESFGKLF